MKMKQQILVLFENVLEKYMQIDWEILKKLSIF